MPRARAVPTATLASLGVDSLTFMEIVVEVEDEFGVALEAKAARVRTVGDLVACVEAQLARYGGSSESADAARA